MDSPHGGHFCDCAYLPFAYLIVRHSMDGLETHLDYFWCENEAPSCMDVLCIQDSQDVYMCRIYMYRALGHDTYMNNVRAHEHDMA